jgi:ribosomal protein S18 acetylase RimI-like enzyme
VTIRPAGPDDLPAIAAIQAASPEASQWKPEDYLSYTCLVFACPLADARGSVQRVQDGPQVSTQNRDRQGADSRKPIQAFIVTRRLAPGENEILNLAVAPTARRSGIARALLNHALSASPGTWYLEVRASNRAAIQLYESAGFRASGSRPGYYGGYYAQSPEPAIVMHFQS